VNRDNHHENGLNSASQTKNELGWFWQAFAPIVSSPGGVARARELILSLAVQGKLVPQDVFDEPAPALLKRIAAEKARLVKAGEIRVSAPLAPLSEDEILSELPKNWAWTRLGEVRYSLGQKTPDRDFSYIDVSSINKEDGVISPEVATVKAEDAPSRARKLVAQNTVIYSTVRPNLLNIAIVDREFDPEPIVSTAFAIIHPFAGVESRYLYWFLRSRTFIDYVESKMIGVAYPAINDDNLFNGPVPLPPENEQQRIVARVDELMERCDDLEALQARQREARAEALRVSLARLLDAPDADSVAARWSSLSAHWHELLDTSASVAPLRQTILGLAVRGQLVPQEPTDEPASHLLKQIAAEKARLVAGKKIKQSAPLPPIKADETPFELPKSWAWVRLDDISSIIHYGYTASSDSTIKDVRLLRITDIQDSKVDWETVPGCVIEPELVENYKLTDGDILIARTGGTIGKSYLVENVSVCAVFASYLIRVVPSQPSSPHYLKLFLGSSLYWRQLYEKSMGTGQPNVNGTSLRSLILPLPPLAEQRRIVARVDELMAHCDALESGLRAVQQTSEALAVAAVRQLARGEQLESE